MQELSLKRGYGNQSRLLLFPVLLFPVLLFPVLLFPVLQRHPVIGRLLFFDLIEGVTNFELIGFKHTFA